MDEECRPLHNLMDLMTNIHKPQPDETIKLLTNRFNSWQDYKTDYFSQTHINTVTNIFLPEKPQKLRLNNFLQQF